MVLNFNRFVSFTLGFLLLAGYLFSQSGNEKWWIGFTDKNGSAFRLDTPEAFLSPRSIQRRSQQNIALDESDLPVSTVYCDSLIKMGVHILSTSKWLNGAVIWLNDLSLLDTIDSLSFIKESRKVYEKLTQKSSIIKFSPLDTEGPYLQNDDYGYSREQIKLCNGQFLHNQGYRGKGKLVAILDGGFYHAQTLPATSNLWAHSQILSVKNFVDDTLNLFEAHPHGMYILSILGGEIPGTYLGSAPDASFLLLRSEDTGSEFPVEEDNWAVAAEYADSMGADVINSSLGYSQFDIQSFDHTYSDLDGQTTHVSKAAAMAASKGILVVNSAGNEGNKSWHYIIAPADASNILAVGAVDSLGMKGDFSSFGPSADGRVKPDVAAMGVATAVQGKSGNILRGNGTSFSSPVIAGLATCLWQAFPDISSKELIKAILVSAPNFYIPSNETGYGIPDFSKAYQYLKTLLAPGSGNSIQIYPNPFKDEISLLIPADANAIIKIELKNLMGQTTRSFIFNNKYSGVFFTRIQGLNSLAAGLYVIKIDFNGKPVTQLLVKQ